MKKGKRLALILSFIMALSCAFTTFAEEGDGGTETEKPAWTATDFTYGTESFELYPAGETDKTVTVDAYVITGLSETGEAKVELNPDLVIPVTDADGKKIQGVGKNALNRNKKTQFTSVTFPENVKAAYDDATWETTGKGLTERGDFFVGYGAFRYNSLTTLELPEGVIIVDTYAFANNTALQSVTFPKTIMQIRSGAFYKDALETVIFPEMTDFALQIDSQTFMSNKITSVTLPSNTEKLHKWTFMQNTGMEPVTSGTAAEKKGGVVYMYMVADEAGAYMDTTSVVQKLILLTDISKLADKAALEYTSVEATGEELKPAVTIEGLTEGTDYTVEYKDNVKPGTATAIITGMGSYARSFTMTFEVTVPAWTAADFTYGTESFELYPTGETDKKITVDAYVITGLSETGEAKVELNPDLVIPATDADGKKIQGVGKAAFKKKYFESLTLPENVKAAYDDTTWETTGKGVTERGDFFIGYEAFRYNNFTTLELPEGVIIVDTYAFGNNTKLETVKFPKTVMQIRKLAFGADALTSVEFPETTDFALQMDAQTFMSNKLTSVTIPSNTEKIEDTTFAVNTGMEAIADPSTAVEKKSGVVHIYMVADELGSYMKTSKMHKYILLTDISKLADKTTLEYTSVEYTGEAFEPAVTIEGLTEGTDYTVAYADNTEIGTASVVITGKGNCVKELTVTFEITPIDVAGAKEKASLEFDSIMYTGKEIKPAVTIEGLTEGTDYTVTYKNNTEAGTATVVITGMGKYAGTIELPFEIIPFTAPGTIFDDVHETDWFNEAVEYVYNYGIMTGMKEKVFGPAENLSRAQFAVILHRMNGAPEVEYKAVFPDVADGEWYTDAIIWANELGVIKGYDEGNFGPADKITREQMAVMMYRYALVCEQAVSKAADISSFTDAAKVSAFAKEAMQWAVGYEIITGKEAGVTLDPQGSASRAECATIIMRYMKLYEE